MKLNEGNYAGDLQRLLMPEIHIDEYKSKMGDDDDIVVVSFLVKGKEPAEDLVSFLETGYDFILDADVSPGEITPGKFLVFVELPRRSNIADRIYLLLEEILYLSLQKMDEWVMTYGKADKRGKRSKHKKYPVTIESLKKLIPDSPKRYRDDHDGEDLDGGIVSTNDADDIAAMKNIAGIPVNQKAPDDEEMNNLKTLSGQI